MAKRQRPVGRGRMARPRYLAVAGALLFAAGVIFLMGIITAEALYPEGYSTAQSELSDLGATEPPDSVIEEPSATIFNTVMIVSGALVLGASFCLLRGFRRVPAPVLIALFGVGVVGVGVFPGDHGTIHALFALLAFTSGGVAAIVSWSLATSPFRYFSVVLGAVSLLVLLFYFILGDSTPMAPLGDGGIERWVAYPILLWMTGLGGHLMGRAR